MTEQYSEAIEDLKIPMQILGGCLELLLSPPSKALHTSLGKWSTPTEASCVPWSILLRWRSKTFRLRVFTCQHINIAVHLYTMLASWVFAAFWLWTAEVWLTAVVRVYLPHVPFQREFWGFAAQCSKSRETLPNKSENSVTDMIGFIAAFFFILILFLFVLLMVAGSESCFWTLKKSFPFSLAYVEHFK